MRLEPAGPEPPRQVEGHDDEDTAVEIVVDRNWTFVGIGFLDADEAALAMVAACNAREHRRDDPPIEWATAV